jgi:hypothetical protein
MNTLRRWIAYDTFKLIVALILLALFIILLLQKPAANQSTIAEVATQTLTGAIPAQSLPTTGPLPTSTDIPQPTFTPVASTTTPLPSPTPTATMIVPTPTATLASTEAATIPAPSPTATLVPAPTATQPVPPTSADCPLAQPSRLSVGQQALVITNLNLRKDAGMDKSIIQVGLPNSKVEIVGGPVCIPYQNGAYLWWNVKTADGITGWSAEASLSQNFYFLQPVP